MSDYFPDEVLEKILLFLPAKSLVRFCCVSKSWNSRITSSDFIHAHLNCSRISTGNNLLVLKHNNSRKFEQFSFRFDNDGLDLHTILDCPFHGGGDNDFGVLGCINGLVCLSNDLYGKKDRYILWNPSIRKYITLPLPQFTEVTNKPSNVAVGFGYDSRTNDYKVVRLRSDEYKCYRAEIFKVCTGFWETISAVDKYWVKYDNHEDQVYCNGAVHWNAYRKDSREPVILKFDMCDEVFSEVMLPACYSELDSTRSFFVAKCGELLSFSCDRWSDIGGFANSHLVSTKEIWVMKEYGVVESWTKLYTIEKNGTVWKTIGLKRNGDVLMNTNDGELVTFDQKTQHTDIIDICDQPFHYESKFYLTTYEPSLVLLGYGNVHVKDSNVKLKTKK